MQVNNKREQLESNLIRTVLDSADYSGNADVEETESITIGAEEQGVTLDISAESYLLQLQEQLDNAEEQKDSFADLAKIIEIARRISHGDHVPASDEKKLMEFNPDLYRAVKMASILSDNKNPKDYKSMYEDEDEDESSEDRDASVQMDSDIDADDSDASDMERNSGISNSDML